MWKSWIHPFLFALYVPLSIFVFNSAEIAFGEVTAPLSIIMAVTAAILIGLHYFGADVVRGAIVLSAVWLVCFQFSNIQGLPGLSLLGERAVLWSLVLALVLLARALRAVSARALDTISAGFLLAGLSFSAYPLLLLPGAIAASTRGADTAVAVGSTGNVDTQPADTGGDDEDVFWILLDAYAGEQTLAAYFEVDNEPFYGQLTERGFQISRGSHSNYDRTLHSLSSILNMDYVPAYAGQYGPDHLNNRPLREAIYHSATLREFASRDYTVSMFAASSHLLPPDDPGYFDHTDSFMTTGQYSLAVVANTPLHALFKADKLFMEIDADRKPWVPGSIDWVFRSGLSLVDNDRRDFVFMHVLCPHEPFYFNADCSVAEERKERPWSDFDGDFADYRDAYRSNLACVNRKVIAFLDEVRGRRGDLPLIVMQGDHGPNEILPETIERAGFDRYRFQTHVLNAYHFGDRASVAIADGMSLVNTWRTVLPAITGEPMELLPHRSFSTVTKKPFVLTPLQATE